MKKLVIAVVASVALTAASASAAEAGLWNWIVVGGAAVVGIAVSPAVASAALIVGTGVTVLDYLDD